MSALYIYIYIYISNSDPGTYFGSQEINLRTSNAREIYNGSRFSSTAVTPFSSLSGATHGSCSGRHCFGLYLYSATGKVRLLGPNEIIHGHYVARSRAFIPVEIGDRGFRRHLNMDLVMRHRLRGMPDGLVKLPGIKLTGVWRDSTG